MSKRNKNINLRTNSLIEYISYIHQGMTQNDIYCSPWEKWNLRIAIRSLVFMDSFDVPCRTTTLRPLNISRTCDNTHRLLYVFQTNRLTYHQSALESSVTIYRTSCSLTLSHIHLTKSQTITVFLQKRYHQPHLFHHHLLSLGHTRTSLGHGSILVSGSAFRSPCLPSRLCCSGLCRGAHLQCNRVTHARICSCIIHVVLHLIPGRYLASPSSLWSLTDIEIGMHTSSESYDR